MNIAEVETRIDQELEKRQKEVVNRNAIRALFSAFSDPGAALGAIFLGRQDALDAERQQIQQDIVLDLLCRIDESLTVALDSMAAKGIVVDGLVDTQATHADEVVGVEIAGGSNVSLQPGLHIRTTSNDVKRTTGLKITGA